MEGGIKKGVLMERWKKRLAAARRKPAVVAFDDGEMRRKIQPRCRSCSGPAGTTENLERSPTCPYPDRMFSSSRPFGLSGRGLTKPSRSRAPLALRPPLRS